MANNEYLDVLNTVGNFWLHLYDSDNQQRENESKAEYEAIIAKENNKTERTKIMAERDIQTATINSNANIEINRIRAEAEMAPYIEKRRIEEAKQNAKIAAQEEKTKRVFIQEFSVITQKQISSKTIIAKKTLKQLALKAQRNDELYFNQINWLNSEIKEKEEEIKNCTDWKEKTYLRKELNDLQNERLSILQSYNSQSTTMANLISDTNLKTGEQLLSLTLQKPNQNLKLIEAENLK